jgi:hypothetical protein
MIAETRDIPNAEHRRQETGLPGALNMNSLLLCPLALFSEYGMVLHGLAHLAAPGLNGRGGPRSARCPPARVGIDSRAIQPKQSEFHRENHDQAALGKSPTSAASLPELSLRHPRSEPKQRYTSSDARRAYMRELMRKRRAAAKAA